jgi:hypothetical protein
VVAGSRGKGAALAYVRSVGLGSASFVVAGTKCQDAALASVRSVGVGLDSHCGCGQDRSGRCSGLCSIGRRGSASHCGGGHDRSGRCSDLCSPGRRGLRQPLWWQERHLRAQHWPLFGLSAWAQPVTVVAGTADQVSSLASVCLVGMGLDIRCGGGHDR